MSDPEFHRQHGFLLTRHAQDLRKNKAINLSAVKSAAANIEPKTQTILWGWTPKGTVKLVFEDQNPLFFVHSEDQERASQILNRLHIAHHANPLKHQSFENKPVSAMYFSTIDDHFKARQQLSGADIETFEHDLKLQDKFLFERNIHGSFEFIGTPKTQLDYTEYTNVRIKPSKIKPVFNVLSLDIECSMEGELYSIGLYGHPAQAASANDKETSSHKLTRTVIMIGQPETTDDPKINIIWVKDEYQLLMTLENQIQLLNPDIIIGWNVINFDFQLLHKQAKKQNLTLRLGRGLSPMSWRDSRTEANQGFVTLPGRVVIDGIDALRTATYYFESFSLENVAQKLLKRGKKTEDVDNRVEHITHDFLHNKQKLAAYNLEDCKLVWDIFIHTEIMDFLILRSQLTGLELDKIGGSVAAFTNLYLPKLHRAGYISPNLPPDGGLASPGGYVMNSLPGFYKNVLVLDFKSLYPSIIRTFKIDPMGLIEGLKDPDNAIPGFKGAMFSRHHHFLPNIIEELWAQRDQAKKDKDGPRSQALKIIMNSFYGVLGSGGCRFYDTRLASSITMRGHKIMQKTALWIEQAGYQVIYGDTDSTFVLLDSELSECQANGIGKQLAQDINDYWVKELREKYNLDCYLELEFETHYHRFLMPTIRGSEAGSKKRYAGLTSIDGKQEMVFKGLETVRTDWTDLARSFQHHLYRIIFDDQDPTHFIKRTVQATLNGENDHQLIYRKRLRRPLRDYVKNVPPHARSAKIADQKNAALGKSLQYQNKGWISYVITLTGPEPIEYRESELDYQHYLEKQLKPIADGILPFIGLDFDRLTDQQMDLF
ncbi:DNA polymerase II [Litoribacillus peritrichatus]|uniref:DNA polymerase n=1 Tax=Litoribacillus peritrichatus TaxID=718191 RepID=A0ABP7M995_9GAMM